MPESIANALMKPMNRIADVECGDFATLPPREFLLERSQLASKLDLVRSPGKFPHCAFNVFRRLFHGRSPRRLTRARISRRRLVDDRGVPAHLDRKAPEACLVTAGSTVVVEGDVSVLFD
jgi:hypothetical protein